MKRSGPSLTNHAAIAIFFEIVIFSKSWQIMAKGFEEEKGGRRRAGAPFQDEAAGARSGTAALRPAKVKVGPGGRIVIPAAFRDALGIREGDTLILSPEAGGSVRLLTTGAAIRQAQAIVRQYVPEGVSLVDELIAERRREAEDESGG